MLHFENVLSAIDSHTEGEPTRVVTAGLPPLRSPDIEGRREELRAHWDHLRRALVHEPRGHDAIVLAYLTPATIPEAHMGVIFANDAGYLGTCGHGSMGVAMTLVANGQIPATEPETRVVLETPVGLVEAHVAIDGGRPRSVRIRNVPSYVSALATTVDVPALGTVEVDVAWGGNWFGFVRAAQVGIEVVPAELPRLMDAAFRIRDALCMAGIEGHHPDGRRGAVDHIKIWEPRGARGARDLTLCPGRAYDRSPCGTGTSAKLAVLAAKGALARGETFTAESVIGSRFEARIVDQVEIDGRAAVVPELTGTAYLTGFPQFVIDPDDPFRHGIPV